MSEQLQAELLTVERFLTHTAGSWTSFQSAGLPWCVAAAPSDDGDGSFRWQSATSVSTDDCVVPVLLYAWNRPAYLRRALASLTALAYADGSAGDGQPARCDGGRMPRLAIFVSLDGATPEVLQVLQRALQPTADAAPAADTPDSCQRLPAPVIRTFVRDVPSWHPQPHATGVMGLKQHWVWFMQRLFDAGVTPELAGFEGEVLFIEDDMALSPDALAAYRVLAGLLRTPAVCPPSPALGPSACWGAALSMFGYSSGPDAAPREFVVRHGHSAAGYMLSRSTLARIVPPVSAARGTRFQGLRRPAPAARAGSAAGQAGAAATEAAAALRHFSAFEDGWDWSFWHMQQVGALPPSFLAPALSRLRNFGEQGITLQREAYAASGLATTPVSALTEAAFVGCATSTGKSGDGSGCSLHVTDTRSEATLPATQPCRGCGAAAHADIPESIQMCPVCAAGGGR